VLATRLAAHCIDFLTAELQRGSAAGAYIGLVEGKVMISAINRMHDVVDLQHRRPTQQWWLDLQPVMRTMAKPKEEAVDACPGLLVAGELRR
jgi:6-phosphofructokinase 1